MARKWADIHGEGYKYVLEKVCFAAFAVKLLADNVVVAREMAMAVPAGEDAAVELFFVDTTHDGQRLPNINT